MKHLGLHIIILVVLILPSCVSHDYDFEDYESKVVVDGWIENGKFPIVLLTRSAGYFSAVDSIALKNYVITSARVEVSDGNRSEVLTLKPNDAYFPPYMYQGTEIKGEPGKTYTLKINFNGKQVTSKTSIPEPVKLDSTYFKLDTGSDSLGFVWVKFSDNRNVNNFYRTLTKVNTKEDIYYATHVPNFNDEYFNGQDIEIPMYKGNKSSLQLEDNFYFFLGDTISLKFTVIDEASFEFWDSFHRELVNTGNPFAATNARVETNINGGLGIWCGYGASYYRVIAK